MEFNGDKWGSMGINGKALDIIDGKGSDIIDPHLAPFTPSNFR